MSKTFLLALPKVAEVFFPVSAKIFSLTFSTNAPSGKRIAKISSFVLLIVISPEPVIAASFIVTGLAFSGTFILSLSAVISSSLSEEIFLPSIVKLPAARFNLISSEDVMLIVAPLGTEILSSLKLKTISSPPDTPLIFTPSK